MFLLVCRGCRFSTAFSSQILQTDHCIKITSYTNHIPHHLGDGRGGDGEQDKSIGSTNQISSTKWKHAEGNTVHLFVMKSTRKEKSSQWKQPPHSYPSYSISLPSFNKKKGQEDKTDKKKPFPAEAFVGVIGCEIGWLWGIKWCKCLCGL